MAGKYSRKHIGKKYITNEGYLAIIVDGGSKTDYCTIKVENHKFEVAYKNIKNGIFKYPFHETVHKVGFFGIGRYKAQSSNKKTNEYRIWEHMMARCYCPKTQEKQPTYKNVTVCKEWHNFQNFAKWCEKHFVENYELDKDLLSPKNNKTYSPDTCLFIPRELNMFLRDKNSNNTSGSNGVIWRKNRSKWVVRIRIDNKAKTFGSFSDKEEAISTYNTVRKNQVKEWQKKMFGILPNYALRKIK